VSRREFLDQYPGFQGKGLTGGVLFHDAQMYNPSRIGLAFLRSAVLEGAVCANYAQTTGYLRRGAGITGVQVKDQLTGDDFDVQGDLVVNAAGPWTESLLATQDIRFDAPLTFSRDACLVVRKKLFDSPNSLVVPGASQNPGALVRRSRRNFFVCPWREYTLVGTWHVVFDGPPDAITVTREDVEVFLEEVNNSQLSFGLKLEDVSLWNAGKVLSGSKQVDETNFSYGKRSAIIDHLRTDNVEGLVSVLGVRWAIARGIAERTVDLALSKLGREGGPSISERTPVYGGDIEDFEAFANDARRECSDRIPAHTIRPLLRNYGTRYGQVLRYFDEDAELANTIDGSASLRAEVVHGVREEMAMKLGDIVFRRTDLGTGENPGNAALEDCARLMSSELGWTEERISEEIEEVRDRFPRFVAEGGSPRET
jgi:glycerol-3-phosphate dehydrogenase